MKNYRKLVIVAGLLFVASCSPAGEKAGLDKKTANTKVDNTTPQIARDDAVAQRIYADYGAVFKAQNGVKPPPTVMFSSAEECVNWQAGLETSRENIGGLEIELQKPAMTALIKSRDEAKQAGVDISPRGADAAKRSYDDTVRLWTSRVEPGLDHWTKNGRLDGEKAARIRALSPPDQVPEILNLETQGMFFNTDFSKSILYSVAAPGTSQHLSMLALDVSQHDNPKVREILARNGWFQTVVSDLPHFTYLGVKESELSSLRLKKSTSGGRVFWTP